jgi:flagellar biosynthesis/type III secretory pathway M-ring protein FliF/YscJ
MWPAIAAGIVFVVLFVLWAVVPTIIRKKKGRKEEKD